MLFAAAGLDCSINDGKLPELRAKKLQHTNKRAQTHAEANLHSHTHTRMQANLHSHTHMSLVMSIVYPAAAALGFLPCSRQCIFQQFADQQQQQQQQLHLLAVPASASPPPSPPSFLLPLLSAFASTPFLLPSSPCSALSAFL